MVSTSAMPTIRSLSILPVGPISHFKTETEKLLEESLNSDDSLLGQEVQNQYKELLLAVNRGKINALNTFKSEISKQLTDELVKRYFYP